MADSHITATAPQECNDRKKEAFRLINIGHCYARITPRTIILLYWFYVITAGQLAAWEARTDFYHLKAIASDLYSH